jgi:hypothetical protein
VVEEPLGVETGVAEPLVPVVKGVRAIIGNVDGETPPSVVKTLSPLGNGK